jgi:hypothetical protein
MSQWFDRSPDSPRFEREVVPDVVFTSVEIRSVPHGRTFLEWTASVGVSRIGFVPVMGVPIVMVIREFVPAKTLICYKLWSSCLLLSSVL